MSPPAKLKTLLVCYPFKDPQLVEKVNQMFEVVHWYPGLAGNDYTNKTEVALPPPQVYAEADVLLTFNLPRNLVHWSQTPELKLLQLVGAGSYQVTKTEYFESIPSESDFILANATGIAVPQISEHVMMTVMMLQHKMQEVSDITRGEKRWASPGELGGMFIQEIRGQTWGVLGYGHLGREIARLAQAFGARVIACTREGHKKPIGGFLIPNTSDKNGDIPIEWYKTADKTSLNQFLGACDIVVNTLPASKETDKFLGEEEFTAMKDSAIIVNVGRGDTMDQEVMVEALQSTVERTGKTGSLALGGASIDVTIPEPLPDNHPLFHLKNVVLTPHCCWSSKLNFWRAIEVLEINAKRLDSGLGAINALRGRGE